jgi:hypothetical protein
MPSTGLSKAISALSKASSAITMAKVQRQKAYDEDNEEDSLKLPIPAFMREEGPVPHFAIIKLASLDIIASFALTIGFSIIGSGVCYLFISSKTRFGY